MDKRDIYEHLAKIYLDASSSKKKKTKARPHFFKNFLIITVVTIAALGAISAFFLRKKPLSSEVALVLVADAAKINFNFNPAKKETFYLNLANINVGHFKALAFSIRKLDYNDTVSLRVEFISSFKEKSEIYFKDVPHKWKDYTINLAQFKGITNWSNIQGLLFSVEEWNTKEDKGIIYIDNVRLLR